MDQQPSVRLWCVFSHGSRHRRHHRRRRWTCHHPRIGSRSLCRGGCACSASTATGPAAFEGSTDRSFPDTASSAAPSRASTRASDASPIPPQLHTLLHLPGRERMPQSADGECFACVPRTRRAWCARRTSPWSRQNSSASPATEAFGPMRPGLLIRCACHCKKGQRKGDG